MAEEKRARESAHLGSLLYLTPDLSDPAAKRRREMLVIGGLDVAMSGFLRGDNSAPPDWNAEAIGRTEDGALGKRVLSVLGQLLRPRKLIGRVKGRDAVLARNLEMLLLACAGLIVSGSKAKLTYEVLDIHRLMLSAGWKSKVLRAVEALLLKRVDRIIISSPGFERAYFSRFHPKGPPRLLVENKVFAPQGFSQSHRVPPQSPPWRIGWFGMLRCSQSFEILARLAAAFPGTVEVDIRGRPSPAVFAEDFATLVARHPGLAYHGPYKAADLPELYGDVHLVWAIDFFEEGLNSDWLLPNRLYEGSAYGRPLIAQRGVETGQWLAAHNSGLLLQDVETELREQIEALTESGYAALKSRTDAFPQTLLVADARACREVAAALLETPHV